MRATVVLLLLMPVAGCEAIDDFDKFRVVAAPDLARSSLDMAELKDCGSLDVPENCGTCGNICPVDLVHLMERSTCCGASCVVEHANAFGGPNGFGPATFYDCILRGTYNLQLAMDACRLYFGEGRCKPMSFANGTLAVSASVDACISWGYEGPGRGRTRVGAVGGPCESPGQFDLAWY